MANDQKKGFSWDDFDKAQSGDGKKPFVWGEESTNGLSPENLEANRQRNAQPTQFELDRILQNQKGRGLISHAMSSGSNLISGILNGGITNPTEAAGSGVATAGQMAADNIDRQQAGRSKAYRIAAPVAQTIVPGLNPHAMEQAADVGDTGGIVGEALTPAAAAASHMGAQALGAGAKGLSRLALNEAGEPKPLVKLALGHRADALPLLAGPERPASGIGAPLPSYEEYAENRGGELNKMRAMDEAAKRRQAKSTPAPIDTPGGFGASLPSYEEFAENRGAELNKIRKMQPQEPPAEAEKPTFVGAPLPSYEDFAQNRGEDILRAQKQQPEAFAPPPKAEFPGAHLPDPGEFYENRGNELNRIRSMNEALDRRQPTTEASAPRIASPSDAGPRFTGNEGSPARWTNERVQQLAQQGNREAIQQSVRRGFELPTNARYVMGDPNFSAGTYNPRDVTTFTPEGAPIRQGGKQLSRITLNPVGGGGSRPIVPGNQFESSFGPEHQEVGDLAEWETGNREGVRPKKIIAP